MSKEDTCTATRQPPCVRHCTASMPGRYGRKGMTYTVGDTLPAAVVQGAWEMATDVMVRKYRGR